MNLTITVFEPGASRGRDVVVDLHRVRTAAELAAGLARLRGGPDLPLHVQGTRLSPDLCVGRPPLVHGAEIRLAGGDAGPAPDAVIRLHVAGGPDAGGVQALHGTCVVGRGSGCDLQVADPALSRAHLSISVQRTGIHVSDLGSTNGTQGAAALAAEALVRVGSSRLRLAPAAGPPLPTHAAGNGRVEVGPSRHARPVPTTVAIDLPEAPGPPSPPRIPWAAALMSIPLAGVLALVVGPQLLWLAVMGPVLAVGSAAAERGLARRRHRRALAADAVAMTAIRQQVARALAHEAAALDGCVPDPAQLLDGVVRRTSPLWESARSDPGFATVRLGWGRPRAQVTLTEPARPRPRASLGMQTPLRHDDAPVLLDLIASGGLVVQGAPVPVRRIVDGLTGQLAVRHRPGDLAIEAVDSPDSAWRWLPHREEPTAVDSDPAQQLASLRRSWGRGPARSRTQVVVIPQLPDGVDLPQVIEDARGAGVVLIIGTDDASAATPLPVLEVDAHDARLCQDGDHTPLQPDQVGPGWVHRLTRALAPLTDPECRPLPSAAPLGTSALEPHWSGTHTDQAVATVGTSNGRPWQVDLDRDGPHVLVGGTTGSGKSELLRTLVASLASRLPPEDLALVLVDYKGGASFGACADLPHTAGVLTDLTPDLAARALRALRAEVTRRERVLAQRGASDRASYLALAVDAGDRAQLARLVIVIDEFRALAQDQPEVLAGIIHLAAVGRSLGVHLVLATQRPGGVVGPDIRANVNLRIALRVRDRHDSLDVIDAPDAASLPVEPGHAVARTGDGDLVPFRVLPMCLPRPATLPAVRWLDGEVSMTASDAPTMLDELVGEIRAGAAQRHSPLPPRIWLPPLPERLAAAEVGDEAAFALSDLPDEQRQEPLTWRPGDGHVLIAGGPRSGRTTTLRTLIESVTHLRPPSQVQVHVLAPRPQDLVSASVPHLGTATSDARRARTLLDRLLADAPDDGSSVHTILVVDDLDALDGPDRLSPNGLSDRVCLLAGADIARVSILAAGGRASATSAYGRLAHQVLVLPFEDVADRALLGLRSADVPNPWPAGRLLRRDRDERWVQAQVVLPGDRPARPGPRTALVLADLPDVVLASDLDPGQDGWPVALGGEPRTTVSWSPARDGRRVLVAGPAGSGRTTVLRRIAHAQAARGRPVAWVAGKGTSGGGRTPLAEVLPSLVTVLAPDDAEALVRLRRAHPDLLVVVDDAELLRDTPAEAPVLEVARLVDRDEGAIVASVDPSAPGQLRGLVPAIAGYRSGFLLQPSERTAGDLLGQRRLDPLEGPPGRGYLIIRGRAHEVQVALDPLPMAHELPARWAS